MNTNKKVNLVFLFWTFFKIGCVAFGGFMSLIAIVRSIVVEKHQLIADEKVIEGISLASVLPGPMAVNVVSYIGYEIRGFLGAIISMIAVILPSFFLLVGLSYIYFEHGNIPAIDKIFTGFMPAVTAIIIHVTYKLSKKNLQIPLDYLFAAIATALLIGIGGYFITLLIIIISAITGIILKNYYANKNLIKTEKQQSISTKNKNWIWLSLLLLFFTIPGFIITNPNNLFGFFSTFSSMSLSLFGGGYVFIPMMQELIVNQYEWVNSKEFIDGIAMGQITPGPIMISAAFIGYKVKGITGALIATIGMFLPPSLIIMLCADILKKVKHNLYVTAAFRAIKASVIGLILAAAYVIAANIEISNISLAIFILSLTLLLKYNLDVLWILLIAGLIGFLFY